MKMTRLARLANVLRDEWRFLTFRTIKPAKGLYSDYLAFGILVTWLCGVGRYYDNPRAELWQMLGIGSLVYVFILAVILWISVLPLKPRNWRYKDVLLFVTMTSPPALIYAYPVELFYALDVSTRLNFYFLCIVAGWRLALLWTHVRKVAELSYEASLAGISAPILLVVFTLSVLDLQHTTIRGMAGIRDHGPTSADFEQLLYSGLSTLAFLLLPFSLLSLVNQSRKAREPKRDAHQDDQSNESPPAN